MRARHSTLTAVPRRVTPQHSHENQTRLLHSNPYTQALLSHFYCKTQEKAKKLLKHNSQTAVIAFKSPKTIFVDGCCKKSTFCQKMLLIEILYTNPGHHIGSELPGSVRSFLMTKRSKSASTSGHETTIVFIADWNISRPDHFRCRSN